MDKNKKRQPTAEEEHRQEVDEVTDMITTEDVVEQAIYMANAPDCCADEHAENMLAARQYMFRYRVLTARQQACHTPRTRRESAQRPTV